MTKRLRNVSYAILCITLFSLCQRSNPNGDGDIEGAWYFIMNDSIYDEIIFSKSTYWGYDEQAGEVQGRYTLEMDSLKTFYFGGKNYVSSKFTRISQDEFIIQNSFFNAHYYRLNIPIDTASLLRGDENALDEYVMKGLRVRRHNWESSRKQ